MTTQSRDEVLVRVQGVSKKFCRTLKRSLWYGVLDTVDELTGRQSPEGSLRPDEFWAVDDVSFELKRGDCLGLLGRNGAGKTTLLKTLTGLIKPDRGRIEMRGRIGALIALGAGFNPILTGRENVYINGSLLGLSKREIDGKIDEIVEFAELADFIDSPVQSYSSGMQVRLGFAVATALDPDVLILDEVLAVGDAAFRAKCYTRIGQMMRRAAVILVSHDANTIGQACNLGVVMERGRSVAGAQPIDAALTAYKTTSAGMQDVAVERALHTTAPLTRGEAQLARQRIRAGEDLEVRFDLSLAEAVESAILRVTVFDKDGAATVEWNSLAAGRRIDLVAGDHQLRLGFGPVNLRGGDYDVSVLFADKTGLGMLYLNHRGLPLYVEGPAFGQAPVQLTGQLAVRRVPGAAGAPVDDRSPRASTP